MARTFGAALRVRRRASGLSQRELAARAGLDFSYISKLENGRIPPPSADTVLRLAKILDAPPDELLALVGKLPSNIHQAVGTSAAAQEFLRTAEEMKLSDDEWHRVATTLRRMRNRAQ